MKINAVNQNYNFKNTPQNAQSKQQSFKGFVPDPVVKGLSKFYERVASSDKFHNLVGNFSKSDRTFTHIMVADSVILSSFYMINTLRNKKIKKEQKPQMVLNDLMTLGVSAAGSYLLDDKVNKAVNTLTDNYINKHQGFYAGDPAKIATFKSGMSKLKTIVVFGMIYRYLGPVLITPLANKLSSKLFTRNNPDAKTNKTQEKK